MPDPATDPKSRLLEAAVTHVPFDGWSETTFKAAIADTNMDQALARTICPRGAVDLAIAYHKRGDEAMLARLAEADLQEMKFRERIAAAVRFRLEAVEDKEIVRRGTTLFALPRHTADGAKLIWDTADAIWTALGDTSEDVNWYTKRATLSGVYSATALYWLGDTSDDHTDSWAFLDRRIDDVMQIEKLKAQVNGNPLLSRLMAGPNWVLSHIKAPSGSPRMDMPGSWTSPRR